MSEHREKAVEAAVSAVQPLLVGSEGRSRALTQQLEVAFQAAEPHLQRMHREQLWEELEGDEAVEALAARRWGEPHPPPPRDKTMTEERENAVEILAESIFDAVLKMSAGVDRTATWATLSPAEKVPYISRAKAVIPVIRDQERQRIRGALLAKEIIAVALDAYLAAELSGPGSARQHALERLASAFQAALDSLADSDV